MSTVDNPSKRPNHRRACRRAVQTVVLSLPALLLGLASCSGPGHAEAAGKPARPPAAPVKVATAALLDMPVQIRAFGNVEAYSTVSVKAQVGGELTEVHFEQGQLVKQGDLLLTIDPRPYQAAVEQAQANLARDAVQAQNAHIVARRVQEAINRSAATKDELDAANTAAAAGDATVNADQAALDNAKLQLEYCYIHSPVNGQTGSLLLNRGNLIKANDLPIVTINQVQPIYVNVSVPQQNLPQIRQYQAQQPLELVASLPGQADQPIRGVLSFVNNQVDLTTGTILLKGRFENQDNRLWPGQFVNVVVNVTTLHNAVVVPAPAVQVGQQGEYVFVVKPDMTVEQRPVQTGQTLGQQTVIAGGLAGGEVVVTDGQLRLRPGTEVRLQSPTTAPASAAEAGTLSISDCRLPIAELTFEAAGGALAEPSGTIRQSAIGNRESHPAWPRLRGAGRWSLALGGWLDMCHDPFRALHPPAGHDHAGHAGHPAVRRHGLPAAAGQRPAERGLPHDPGHRRPARGQPGDHGLGGGHAAGEAVLHHRRHRLDDLLQRAGHHADHAAVRPRAATSTPPPRTCRPPSPRPRGSCRRTCPRRRPTRRSTRPTSRSCSSR